MVKKTDAERQRKHRAKARADYHPVTTIQPDQLFSMELIRKAVSVLAKAMESEHEPTALRAATNFLRLLPTTRLAEENIAIQRALLAREPDVRNSIIEDVREQLGIKVH